MITGVVGTKWQPINHLSHWDNASASHFYVIYLFLFQSVIFLFFHVIISQHTFSNHKKCSIKFVLDIFLFVWDFRE